MMFCLPAKNLMKMLVQTTLFGIHYSITYNTITFITMTSFGSLLLVLSAERLILIFRPDEQRHTSYIAIATVPISDVLAYSIASPLH